MNFDPEIIKVRATEVNVAQVNGDDRGLQGKQMLINVTLHGEVLSGNS